MKIKTSLVMICLVVVASGCTTTRSTPMNRAENDSLHKSICPSPRGIPITIKVPTHVDIYVNEKYFYQTPTPGGDLQQIKMNRPNLWVDVKPIETDKLITVDWKRPLSGTLAYSATLGDDQYFDAIGSTVTDTTIDDVTAAIQAVAAVQTAAGAVQGHAGLFEDDRVVAYKRFDLDACDVEAKILEFVQYHLNGCNNCQGVIGEGPIAASEQYIISAVNQ